VLTERSVLARGPVRPPVPPGVVPGPGGDGSRYSDDGVATALLTALTIASAAGFARVFTTGGWVGPVMVTAIAIHGAAWGLRRAGVRRSVAVPVTLGLVAVLSVYLVLPTHLSFGLPLRQAWEAVGNALVRDRHDFASMTPPVPASGGFTLLAVWGVGLAATVADLLAFRFRSALQALLGPFAVFVACCALGRIDGRTWAVGLEVTSMVAFFLGHRLTIGRRGTIWFGDRRAGATGWALTVGATSAAVAIIAAIVITPAFPRAEGTGVLGWKINGGGANSNRVTPSPLDDVRTRLIQESNLPVMTVQSSQPSYWRLTSLDTFNGTLWESNDSYQDFAANLPGVAPPPRGTRAVEERFHIEALDSIWLPSAFDPEAVTGGHHITWDPTSGSLISSQPTANGQSYQVTSLQVLSTLRPTALASVPLVPAAAMARYLALPASLPPSLVGIARSVTAGATTEYAKAVALQDYFHTNAFTYSLSPPSDDSANALVDFLTTTKTGYCQQFAGAFAVLARLAGLPTRIAVGFQSGGFHNGAYQVTDADAHAWPEVYFPTVGWVPFEPTPGRQIPSGGRYTGTTATQGTTAPTPAVAPPVPSASAAAPHTFKRVPVPAPTTTTVAPAPGRRLHPAEPALPWIGVGFVCALALLAAGVGSIVVGRRARWRRRARTGQRSGTDRVLTAWAEATEMLAWWHMPRRADESATEFAHRAAHEVRVLLGETYRQGSDLLDLAAAVDEADFGVAADLSDERARRAEATARHLTTVLEGAASRGKRLRRVCDPSQVWGPVTVAPPAAVLSDDADPNGQTVKARVTSGVGHGH